MKTSTSWHREVNTMGTITHWVILTLREEPPVWYLFVFSLASTRLVSTSQNVLAQSPYGQQQDPQALLNQNPYMQDMQVFRTKYDDIRKEKDLERKAVIDQFYAEEIAKAKKEQATQGPFYESMATSEWLQNGE